ncbi:WXG100-like domain-containing protein [Kitasatospora sp. NPDC054939]
MAVSPNDVQLSLLGMMGLQWPEADEDNISAFGRRLARFAADLDTAGQGAVGAVAALGESYRGESAAAFTETAGRAAGCVTQAVSVAGEAAVAVENVAALVLSAKVQVLQLLNTAAVEAGVSALNPVSALTGQSAQIVVTYRTAIATTITRHVQRVAETGGRAAGAVEAVVAPEALGQVFGATGGAAGGVVRGVGGGAGNARRGYSVDVEQLVSCVRKLRSGADEMSGHGQALGSTTADLSAGPAGSPLGQVAEEVRQRITRAVVGGAPALGGLYVRIAENLERTAADYRAAESGATADLNAAGW